jgi:mRNA (2'-O-methyladenosine-N6-)-methyltransferase
MTMPGMQRMMPGMMPLQRPFMSPSGVIQMGAGSGPMPTQQNQRTEEEDLKDLEVLLSKKTYKEKQNTKTGEELLDLIHRPTAKETAVAAKVCFHSTSNSKVAASWYVLLFCVA